jgi:Fe-S-cluster-containing dehydrogenase component
VKACPRDALVQSEENSIILIDEEKCDACGWCIPACPYGAILLHPEKQVVMVCDLCEGEPKCIEFCPEEALDLITDDDAAQSTWVSSLDKVIAEAEKLLQLIKADTLTSIFLDVDARINKLEEKLKALHKKELETYAEP